MITANTGPYGLTKTWAVDGTATDVGDVTIGIVDAAGTTVVASGTATVNNSDGTYSYTLADQTAVKLLTITWTRADTSADIVDTLEVSGGRLFTETEARAFDNAAMTSTSTYTDAKIAAEHDRIADLLEEWTSRSWIPRYRQIQTWGTSSRSLAVDAEIPYSLGGSNGHGSTKDIRSIISADDGSTVTTSNITIIGNVLYRTDANWSPPTTSDPLNVTVEYEYGLPHLMAGVNRIALLLLRERLVPSNIDDRTSRFTDDLGTYSFVTPGLGNAVSSIPEVNDWVRTHDARSYIG